MTGRAKVDPVNGQISSWTVSSSEVKTSFASGEAPKFGGEDGLENTIWAVVNPAVIESGAKVIFSGETTNYVFSKEVALPENLEFPEGQIAVINLSINEDNYSKKASETRILVEGFDGVAENKTQAQPDATGVKGTGVNDKLAYVYTGSNTNIRINLNGQTSTNPYLFFSKTSDSFSINNVAVSDVSAIKFTCMLKGTLALQYKESASDTWTTASAIDETASFEERTVILSISSAATSIDIKMISGADQTLVDDIVLESFEDNRTALEAPSITSAALVEGTPNSIFIKWGAVEGAGSYVVTATSTTGEAKTETVQAPVVECTLTGLAYETEYTISVVAKPENTATHTDSAPGVCADKVTTEANPNAGQTITVEFLSSDFTDLATLQSGLEKEGVIVKSNTTALYDPIRIYGGKNITVSSASRKITQVVMTASTASYAKTWSASDNTTVSVSATTILWANESGVDSIVLTNTNSAQARITSIVVTAE